MKYKAPWKRVVLIQHKCRNLKSSVIFLNPKFINMLVTYVNSPASLNRTQRSAVNHATIAIL